MQSYVLAHQRKSELRRALELGPGSGRVYALLELAHGAMSLRELATRLSTDAPHATVIVDALEERGLARRRVDAHDKRRKLVTLTEAGHRAVHTAHDVVNAPPPGFERLDAHDLQCLSAVLAKLHAPSHPSETTRHTDTAGDDHRD